MEKTESQGQRQGTGGYQGQVSPPAQLTRGSLGPRFLLLGGVCVYVNRTRPGSYRTGRGLRSVPELQKVSGEEKETKRFENELQLL